MIRTAIEFHAREYSSAAEILAAAARRRNSPYRCGPAEKAEKRAPVLAPVAVIDGPPMWRRMEIHFDAHVIDRQRHLAGLASRWKAYIRAQAEANGFSYSEVTGRSRKRALVPIRQHIWLEMRRAGKSFPEIAQIFSGRDHTTVLSGVRAAERKERDEGSAS